MKLIDFDLILYSGMYHAQYPGVMVDIIGLENNEWGMGIVVALTGASAFVGIPFAGTLEM